MRRNAPRYHSYSPNEIGALSKARKRTLHALTQPYGCTYFADFKEGFLCTNSEAIPQVGY